MFLLTNLVLWGNIGENLLAEARQESGFNSTQAQICVLLAGLNENAAPRSLTPTEISRAMCSPGAKVHNQLKILIEKKLLQRSTHVATSNERLRHYSLTRNGIARTRIYWEQARRAEEAFEMLLLRKEVESLERLALRLLRPIELDAFASREKLVKSLVDSQMCIPKRQRL